jgi:signal transduction histidine kinase
MAALGVGLVLAGGRADRPGESLHHQPRGAAWVLLVFVLLSAGLVTAGDLYQRGFEHQYRAEVESLLSTVAEWKVSELTQWRLERVGDGKVILGNDSFAELVARPDENASALTTWLGRLRESYQYERVLLADESGAVFASVPPSAEPVAPQVIADVRRVLHGHEVRILDLHRDTPDGPIHLSVLVPIHAPPPGDRPLAVLELRVDPYLTLYPMIQRWPTSSRTAETLLVRREGDDVVFLNELRFRRGTALTLRESLSQRRLPAARAALGEEGIFEGVDYRGVEVLSYLRSIPDSPWALVARVDTAEVYAPLRERLWLTVGLVMTLLLASGAALSLVFRQQAMRFYRGQFESAAALRASESELKERNDELTRFTYSVSHDLKSPLVTIQTFLGYLENDLSKHDSASVEKDFGFIRGAAQKMARLLDEVLQLSRVGRSTNPPEDVTLQSLVGEALTLVAGRVAARGVQIDITTEAIVLHGDRVRLVEVFQNLIDNAVKFMGTQPAPRVEIGVEASDLELFVRDNGVGIDPRHIGKLFGLFEKLDPKSEGTGIGLALVKRIVEAHGGRIKAESGGTGHGACFRFTLAGTRRGQRKEAP